MGLLDFFTGGSAGDARSAMARAREVFAGLDTPDLDQLTLPELQQYVEAGVITPAQAEAFLQGRNAMEGMDIDQTGTQAQIDALTQLARVADAGAEGTPESQARVAQIQTDMNRSVGGQRGAIAQAMQARGIPASLIQAVLEGQAVGEDASRANQAAMDARAADYNAALEAMSARAAGGANLQGQQNAQANTVAAATNAMEQFNAANQTSVAESNANRRMAAETANKGNKQNVSNLNTATENDRTKYNANLPQQMFENELRKASGEAGADQNAARLAQEQGRQEAGIISGLLGTAGTVVGGMAGGPAGAAAGGTVARNLPVDNRAAHGMVADDVPCYEAGDIIPGEPEVMGDSLENDKVHAMVSPGEAVLPRTAVMRHMPEVLGMLAESRQEPDVSPEDLANLLRAMKTIRMEAASA